MRRLSVRERADIAGDRLSERVQVEARSGEGSGSPRLIVLVHGYQNSADKAGGSFRTFERGVSIGLGFRPASLIGSLCHFHWPGDHARLAVSVMTYSSRVRDAIDSGKLLAKYLAKELDEGQEVVLVGHSLGCRVVVAALRELRVRQEKGKKIRCHVTNAFLLAAAVPVKGCIGVDQRWSIPTPGVQEHVFFSHRDEALGQAFRLGEYMYARQWSDAVGRQGDPHVRWKDAECVSTGYRHGQYWGSQEVANALVSSLGLCPTGHVAERSLAALPFENLPVARLPERRTAERAVAGAR